VTSQFAQLTEVLSEPIPLSVLTGFLGSGKTTLPSKVLSLPDLRDTAVVISDADRTSRVVFIARDLETDEILRRFADGASASIGDPTGVF
jgi:G3E family GTPase